MNNTLNKVFVLRDATGFQKIVNTANYSDKNSMIRIKKMLIPVSFFLEKAQAGCTYTLDKNGELRVLQEDEKHSWKDLMNLNAIDLDENGTCSFSNSWTINGLKILIIKCLAYV
jgi:hypothetical protein